MFTQNSKKKQIIKQKKHQLTKITATTMILNFISRVRIIFDTYSIVRIHYTLIYEVDTF